LSKNSIARFSEFMGFTNPADLFYNVHQNKIATEEVEKFIQLEKNEIQSQIGASKKRRNETPDLTSKLKSKQGVTYDLEELDFGIATCCHPLPGDEIIAYTPDGTKWIVHRTNCPDAIELMARRASRIIHASWGNRHMNTFLGGVKISGFDRKSMISDIIRVISDEMHYNVRSFHIDTSGELFEAYISFFIHDTLDINRTIEQIKKIEGVSTATRMLKFLKT